MVKTRGRSFSIVVLWLLRPRAFSCIKLNLKIGLKFHDQQCCWELSVGFCAEGYSLWVGRGRGREEDSVYFLVVHM